MSHLEACKRAAAGYRETIAYQVAQGDVDPKIIGKKRRDLQGYDRVIYLHARNAYEANQSPERHDALLAELDQAEANWRGVSVETVRAEYTMKPFSFS